MFFGGTLRHAFYFTDHMPFREYHFPIVSVSRRFGYFSAKPLKNLLDFKLQSSTATEEELILQLRSLLLFLCPLETRMRSLDLLLSFLHFQPQAGLLLRC